MWIFDENLQKVRRALKFKLDFSQLSLNHFTSFRPSSQIPLHESDLNDPLPLSLIKLIFLSNCSPSFITLGQRPFLRPLHPSLYHMRPYTHFSPLYHTLPCDPIPVCNPVSSLSSPLWPYTLRQRTSHYLHTYTATILSSSLPLTFSHKLYDTTWFFHTLTVLSWILVCYMVFSEWKSECKYEKGAFQVADDGETSHIISSLKSFSRGGRGGKHRTCKEGNKLDKRVRKK